VAEKLRAARPGRFAREITGRKSDLHHLSGRRTQSQRLDDAFQTRTWDARRANKRAGCALRSCWNFRGSPTTSNASAACGNQIDYRRAARVRVNSQRSRWLVTDRAQGRIIGAQPGRSTVTQTILSARIQRQRRSIHLEPEGTPQDP